MLNETWSNQLWNEHKSWNVTEDKVAGDLPCWNFVHFFASTRLHSLTLLCLESCWRTYLEPASATHCSHSIWPLSTLWKNTVLGLEGERVCWVGHCCSNFALCWMQSLTLWDCWREGSREQGGRDPETATVMSLPPCCQTFSVGQWFLFSWTMILYYSCVNTYGILTILGFILHLRVDL